MLSISKAAAKFGLSRSTLLYYDRLGLVRPTYRTAPGYRLYQKEDLGRLARVCRYRKAGLPLKRIAGLLETRRGGRKAVEEALNERLSELNREIAGLRRQQQVVVRLLRLENASGRSRIMTKESWSALLDSVGLDAGEKAAWHAAFERQAPEAHQDFLESLGLPDGEIRRIREACSKFLRG